MRQYNPFQIQRAAASDCNVVCPECGKAPLTPSFSCLTAAFYCSGCNTRFELSDLAPKLKDEDFEKLAEFVEHRYSDRI